jgi:hypothetical protein
MTDYEEIALIVNHGKGILKDTYNASPEDIENLRFSEKSEKGLIQLMNKSLKILNNKPIRFKALLEESADNGRTGNALGEPTPNPDYVKPAVALRCANTFNKALTGLGLIHLYKAIERAGKPEAREELGDYISTLSSFLESGKKGYVTKKVSDFYQRTIAGIGRIGGLR